MYVPEIPFRAIRRTKKYLSELYDVPNILFRVVRHTNNLFGTSCNSEKMLVNLLVHRITLKKRLVRRVTLKNMLGASYNSENICWCVV